MKLSKIVLKNFRNYKDEHVFELNKHVTILLGDNGNGKSSFFDGIEWCLTGVIGRFMKKAPKEALANKDMNLGEECFVEIYFSKYYIKRSFYKQSNGYGNIEFTLFEGNKKIVSGEESVDLELREIFKQHGVNYNNPKYKVGEAISKAYILSQDQVTDFVTREKAYERYNALANIMGFEKVLKIRKNIETTLRSFGEILQDTNNEQKHLKERIDELHNELKFFDETILNKFNLIYGIEPNTREIELKIDDLQNKIFNKQKEYDDINNNELSKISSLEGLNSLLEKLNSNLNILNEEVREEYIKKDDTNNKIKEIKDLLNELSINQNKNKTIIELNNQLISLSSDLSNLNVNFQTSLEFKKAINDLNKEYRLTEFARKNKKDYHDSNTFLDNFEAKLKVTGLKLQDKEKLLNEVIDKKILLEKEILELDKDSSLNGLIQSIEEVYNYITHNEVDGTCPVCLSKLGDKLEGKVSTNLNTLILEVGKKKDIVVEKINAKDEFDLIVIQLKNDIQTIEYEIKDLYHKKKVSNESIRLIKDSELYSEYLNFTEENLNDIENNCTNNLKKYNKGLKLLEQIQSIQEKLKDIDVDSNILGINNIHDLRNKATSLETNFEISKVTIDEKKKHIEKLNGDIYKIKQFIDTIRDYFEMYNVITVSELLETLLGQKRECEDLTKLLKENKNLIEIQTYNNKINTKISAVLKEKDIVDQKLLRINSSIEDINRILNKLDNEYGNEATDFLNSENSAIQMYYKYLNPSPSKFNKLYFDVKNNEELYIKIIEEGNEDISTPSYCAEANMVLSSGQLNVLALSIFIATNEAQDSSYFDFIAIDDPIQNMDDVNRFSICDVLSQLNRQLIFSTHDQDFLNLFLKKNENYIENITLYKLDSNENKYISLNV